MSRTPRGYQLDMVSAEKRGIKLLRLKHLASEIPWFVSQPVSKYCGLHIKGMDLNLNYCAPHMLRSFFFSFGEISKSLFNVYYNQTQ